MLTSAKIRVKNMKSSMKKVHYQRTKRRNWY